jgi:tRNA-Thr(GGU) m(6)t(6)A37 methyltransferase TsaA
MEMGEGMALQAIGRVESPLTDPASAPKQGSEGAPEAWIVFEPEFRAGLTDIGTGDRVIVLTWLDRARRDVLQVHPRDDPANPMHGVFSTRSADRPNPIGLHEVDVAAVEDLRVRVRDLEAVDGTPVVDVEPVLGRSPAPDRRAALGRGGVATRLPAQDLGRARRFYAEKLGLEPAEERPGGLLYRAGSGKFALRTATSPG